MEKRIFLSPPHLFGNERKYVDEVFASNYIAPVGPMLNRFEKVVENDLGSRHHALALASATSGLDLIFDLLGVGRGDVVICSDLTFIASISPAVRRGAVPCFIDSDLSTWQMDPDALEETITTLLRQGKTIKAIVAVDLYGSPCDYARIEKIALNNGIPVVEDAAEAMGAEYLGGDNLWHNTGEAGIAAVYSFNGNKIITSSGGGMMISEDKALIEKARKLSQQAKENFPWYEHEELGYNYRMSNLSAAVGLGQYELLNKKVARRREIFRSYSQRLSDLTFMQDGPWSKGNRWLTTALLPDDITPQKVIDALQRENIESRHIWKPMHLQPIFNDAHISGGGAVSSRIFTRGICLPSGDSLCDDEVAVVAEIVNEEIKKGL